MDRKNSRNEKEIQDEENNSLTAFPQGTEKRVLIKVAALVATFSYERKITCAIINLNSIS